MTGSEARSTERTGRRVRWRVVDIVVASVLAVAVGVVFWLWDVAYTPVVRPFEVLAPGVQGIINGPWLVAGVLGGLVVRRPGAAVFTELVAAAVSALIGTQWGWTTLLSGVVQGLGAEIVFALLLYRSWSWWAAALAGAGAGVAESVLDLLVSYPGAKPGFAIAYTVTTTLSGLVVAGLGSWVVVRALARAGALARFPAGRERTARV